MRTARVLVGAAVAVLVAGAAACGSEVTVAPTGPAQPVDAVTSSAAAAPAPTPDPTSAPSAVDRVSAGGTNGTVELSGAVSWSGSASGTCSRYDPQVVAIKAQLPVGELALSVYDPQVAEFTLSTGTRSSTVQYATGARSVLTVTGDSVRIRSAALADPDGAVTRLSAEFDC